MKSRQKAGCSRDSLLDREKISWHWNKELGPYLKRVKRKKKKRRGRKVTFSCACMNVRGFLTSTAFLTASTSSYQICYFLLSPALPLPSLSSPPQSYLLCLLFSTFCCFCESTMGRPGTPTCLPLLSLSPLSPSPPSLPLSLSPPPPSLPPSPCTFCCFCDSTIGHPGTPTCLPLLALSSAERTARAPTAHARAALLWLSL